MEQNEAAFKRTLLRSCNSKGLGDSAGHPAARRGRFGEDVACLALHFVRRLAHREVGNRKLIGRVPLGMPFHRSPLDGKGNNGFVIAVVYDALEGGISEPTC